jgi:monoamine oxidase
MAKTPLLHSLRRALARSRLERVHGVTRAARLEREALAHHAVTRLERRRVLQLSVAAATAASCVEGEELEATPVAVIGAGIAGVHCAYRLAKAGARVMLYEASDRIGGRMFTARDVFPDGQIAELGGELIDSNHETLLALSEELGLTLDDRWADEPAGFKRDVYHVGGVEVPEATIVEQFGMVAPIMESTVTDAEEDDALFEEVDNTSLAAWLDANVPAATYPELNAILATAYRGEYGLEADEQSVFNLLYLIDYEEPDPFRIFGDSDERWHTHEGNDSFPSALAANLDGRYELDAKLTSLRENGSGYVLGFRRSDGSTFEREAHHVVLALPFSVLREVDLSASGLSEDKLSIIRQLGYGTNAKVMGAFTSRVWRDQHNASGSLTTDLPPQQTWDTSIGQSGSHGILTNFLGGAQGTASADGTPDEWLGAMLGDLETVWPGLQAAYVPDSAVRMHWPTAPNQKGSYTCYRPGQWAFWSLEGTREGNLHFCGEHCSLDFQGWMEGAAETGALVAAEILEDLGVDVSPMHAVVLGDKRLLPQACYGAQRSPRLRWMQRRRLARTLVGRRRY